MEDALPLTAASVARSLQQRRLTPELHASRRDPRILPDIESFLSRSTPDTCQLLGAADMRGCRQPRSCRECLQREGCMVAGVGCARASFYSEASDYRRVGIDGNGFSMLNATSTTQNSQACYYYSSSSPIMFPSTSTAYCSASDPACKKCQDSEESFSIFVNVSDRLGDYKAHGLFCLGTNSCVCIAACEDSAAASEAFERSHCRYAATREDADPYTIMATFMIVLALAVFAVYWWIVENRTTIIRDDRAATASHLTSNSVRGVRRFMLDAAPALHLDLYGWRHFQHEILRKERELLSGAGDISPVAYPMAFEFAAIATAPDFDEEEESTAPTIMNPHALASAPVFRLHAPGGDDNRNCPSFVQDYSVPSAPDFE